MIEQVEMLPEEIGYKRCRPCHGCKIIKSRDCPGIQKHEMDDPGTNH